MSAPPCVICHEPLDDGLVVHRSVHVHCYGTLPTEADLIVGFLASFPFDEFCEVCLMSAVGLSSRRDLARILTVVGSAGVTMGKGVCGRCRRATDVISAGDRVAARPH